MGKNAMKVGPMTREGAGSSLSEAPPDSPIYKRGWFVGGSTLKNFLSEARKKISEANEIKKDTEDTSEQ